MKYNTAPVQSQVSTLSLFNCIDFAQFEPQAQILMLRSLDFCRTRARNTSVEFEYRWC